MANKSRSVPKSAKDQVERVVEGAANTFATILNQSSNPKWFPHGITKIDVAIKAYGVELTVGVSGPDSAGPKVAAGA